MCANTLVASQPGRVRPTGADYAGAPSRGDADAPPLLPEEPPEFRYLRHSGFLLSCPNLCSKKCVVAKSLLHQCWRRRAQLLVHTFQLILQILTMNMKKTVLGYRTSGGCDIRIFYLIYDNFY